MSAPGTVRRGDPLRRACGELAFLAAVTAVARLDPEHEETQAWLDQAARLAAQLPPGAVMLEAHHMQALATRLAVLRGALDSLRRLPSGERDWTPVGDAQGALREVLTNAMASLYHRALPVWSRGEPPPWESFVEPEPEGETVVESEGAG